MILLQSKSETFPNGLANHSDQVGRNLMDHVSGANATGYLSGFDNKTTFGRRPSGGIYIPRYANLDGQDKPYRRGFGFQGGATSVGNAGGQLPGIGRAFKEAHKLPSAWRIGIGAFGEQLSNPENRVTLHASKRDKWGNPIALFNVKYGDNEYKMLEEASKDAVAMLEAAGCTNITATPVNLTKPGNRIHEMGRRTMLPILSSRGLSKGRRKDRAWRKETGSSSENLSRLQAAFCVAEKMGEELGRG